MALDSTTVAYAAEDTPAANIACQSAGVQFFPDTTAQVTFTFIIWCIVLTSSSAKQQAAQPHAVTVSLKRPDGICIRETNVTVQLKCMLMTKAHMS